MPQEALVAQLVAPRCQPARDGEAPTAEQLRWILDAATAVPDHGGLHPWRFVVVAGEHRRQFGDALAAGVHEVRSDPPTAVVDKMRGKAFTAPCIVVLIASPQTGSNVPEWEQVASASCCGYAMVVTAAALGLGAIWKSASIQDGVALRSLFHLTEEERLLGWVNVGTIGDDPPQPRASRQERVDLRDVVTVLEEDGVQPYEAGAR